MSTAQITSERKVPVTLITGFLGSGKTSLLNHLLSSNPNTRFAIVENEFGEIPIDGQLVVSQTSGIFELSNGCLCCSLDREWMETALKLADKADDFDHLLIETTGMADPAPVLAPFISVPYLQKRFFISRTIALADASTLEESLSDTFEAKLQLTFADTLLVNKTDLVAPPYLDTIKGLLHSINPLAQVVDAKNGQPFAEIDLLQPQYNNTEEIDNLLNKIEKHHHHEHSHITSLSFTFSQPFDEKKLKLWLAYLLPIQGHAIYRIKGIFDIEGNTQKTIIQSVRQQLSVTATQNWKAGEERVSKVVIIGKDLKAEVIENRLKKCLAKEGVMEG